MIRALFLLVTIALLGALSVGFLGSIHPAFDTAANFRAHICAALVVMALIWIFKYGVKTGLLLLLVAAGGYYLTVNIPAGYSQRATQDISSRQLYSLLQLNLYYNNKTPQKVFALIDDVKPDIITLNEISGSWKQRLNILDKDYPYKFYCPEWANMGGSVIFSRYAIANDQGYCHEYAALALKDIQIEDKSITVGVVHLRWPWPASGPRQVDDLKKTLNQLGPTALIAGDFNSTTWTWTLRRFAHYGGLKILSGIGPTWLHQKFPAWLIAAIGFPIDNAMVKGSIAIEDVRTLEPVGSDHLPILIRFAIL